MRIGLVATRLAGTDGVSLETAKWRTVLQGMGHEVVVAAGELGPAFAGGTAIPGLRLQHPTGAAVSAAAFRPGTDADALRAALERSVRALLTPLRRWLDATRPELLVVENAWAIPMQLPAGVALARLVAEAGVPAIGHHHDFAWERDRFAHPVVPEVLDEAFPPDLPCVAHAVINSAAAEQLERRRGLRAHLVPNVLDFAVGPPPPATAPAELRRALGLDPGDLVVLQPTRVVPRKGIELAIELLGRLRRPGARLLISHPAGDEGLDCLAELQALARTWQVDLRYLAARFDERPRTGRRPVFAFWDAYAAADLVTYPSRYEGFGNALLEAVLYRRPVVVGRYPVFVRDIAPLGFRFVEVGDTITEATVEDVRALLDDPDARREATELDYELARRHFSYEVLRERLEALVADALSGASAPTSIG